MISCAWGSLESATNAPRPSLHGRDGLDRPGVTRRISCKPSRLHTSLEVTKCRFGSTSRQAAPVGFEDFAPQNFWTPIHHAVYHDREAALQHFLQIGLSPNSVGGSGVPLLSIAAACGHSEIAEILLKAGAQVDLTSKSSGETAVHVAIRAGRHDILDLMLLYRADLGSRTLHTGQTALHYAAAGPDSLPMVTKLLKSGAKFDAEDTQGRTPAVVALQSHNLQAALAIINMARGKRKQLVKEKGLLLQHVEQAKNRDVVTNDLIANAFAATCDPDSTVLIEAVKKNDAQVVQMLLEEGINPRECSATGLQPLFVAVKFSNLRIIKLLIQHGADITGRGPGNLDVLQFLFKTFTTRDEESVVTIVEYLLAKGADCMVRYPDRKTLLHRVVSVKAEYLGIVELLIRNGVTIDAQDKDGATALHFAASNGLSATVMTLIDCHADKTIVDAQTRTALLRAIKNQQWLTVPLLAVPPSLTSWDAGGSTALHHIAASIPRDDATWEDIASATTVFCERSACRSMRDHSGATPLIRAIRSLPENGLPVIESLLTKGDARWNCIGHEDHAGHDALYYAAILGKIAFVKALLEHEAPFNLKQWTDAQRPSMMAKASTKCVLEILEETDRLRNEQVPLNDHCSGPRTRIEIVKSQLRTSSAMSGYNADCEMERTTKSRCSASKRSSSSHNPLSAIQDQNPAAHFSVFPTRTTKIQQRPKDKSVSCKAPLQPTHAIVSLPSAVKPESSANTKTVRFTRHDDHFKKAAGRSSPSQKLHQDTIAFPTRTSSRVQIAVQSRAETCTSGTIMGSQRSCSLASMEAIASVGSATMDVELAAKSSQSIAAAQIPSKSLIEPVQLTPTPIMGQFVTTSLDQSTDSTTPTFEEATEPKEPEKPRPTVLTSTASQRSVLPPRVDSAVNATGKDEISNAGSALERFDAIRDRATQKTKRQSADELASWLAISNMLDRL